MPDIENRFHREAFNFFPSFMNFYAKICHMSLIVNQNDWLLVQLVAYMSMLITVFFDNFIIVD